MDALIGGLVVAAITALSVIAYRHPASYKRVAWAALGICWLIVVGEAIFAEGFKFGVRFASNPQAAQQLSDNLDTYKWIAFGVAAWAAALEWLPRLIKDLQKKRRIDEE